MFVSTIKLSCSKLSSKYKILTKYAPLILIIVLAHDNGPSVNKKKIKLKKKFYTLEFIEQKR